MSNNRLMKYSFVLLGGLGILFNISGCGTEDKGSIALKQESPSTKGLIEFGTNVPPIRCPKETLLKGTTIDYRPDSPVGPQTPEQAVQEFLEMDDKRDPRSQKLSVEDFSNIPGTVTSEKSDTPSQFRNFKHSHPQLGDYMLHLEKVGDSWRVSSTQICNSLDSALRGKS